MRRVVVAVPGSLDTPTGGYGYDKRIVAELRTLGWQVDVIDLGAGFPKPDRGMREAAMAKLLAVPEGCPIVIDGLAYGVMEAEATLLSSRNPLIALVHHPLAFETGIDAERAAALQDSERAALVHARAVIVTGNTSLDILTQDYGVPRVRITVIPPGIDAVSLPPRGRRAGESVNLLSVGSIVPRKGHEVLVAALDDLKTLPWRLTIAGDTTRDLAALARLTAMIEVAGLQGRIVVTGAVGDARLAELYGQADALVLASLFEGYGMVFAEAIAHGLPVVATDVGAARAVIPPDAGILVSPGDRRGLSDALHRVIADDAERERMAVAARQAAVHLPQWREAGAAFARVLEACR
ncbi:glycosyl transferase [Afipia sp. P52-10]|uniref:glycosyltransferase family 4 protein n=1 Tax=Afipia sp. P52-10 TaxID=1429916 RepID=UPI0003DF45D2|nr:glycosyltransferase family 4 protein [Afipia sp. P52-10]ETR77304.1 glycosyl transferase [Afipia sp. P52-10]